MLLMFLPQNVLKYFFIHFERIIYTYEFKHTTCSPLQNYYNSNVCADQNKTDTVIISAGGEKDELYA